jgi:hypothetical protein
MAKIKTRVTFDRAATIARIKAASNDALTAMGNQALMDASKHVPKDQDETLENSGLSLSDKKAVEGIYTLRWNTPYAKYLWHGKIMHGTPGARTPEDYYGDISFTSALAHEEWAKYAKEIYGEEWKAVYQAALKEKMR